MNRHKYLITYTKNKQPANNRHCAKVLKVKVA